MDLKKVLRVVHSVKGEEEEEEELVERKRNSSGRSRDPPIAGLPRAARRDEQLDSTERVRPISGPSGGRAGGGNQ